MLAFDIQKTVSYWVDGAQYDMSVANVLLKSKKYPYALFMGHLALEKLIKALIVKREKTHAPFSHSLPFLPENANMEFPEDVLVHLREFMEFHFEARYPDVTKEFYKKCTRDYTDRRLKEMKKVFRWVKAKL